MLLLPTECPRDLEPSLHSPVCFKTGRWRHAIANAGCSSNRTSLHCCVPVSRPGATRGHPSKAMLEPQPRAPGSDHAWRHFALGHARQTQQLLRIPPNSAHTPTERHLPLLPAGHSQHRALLPQPQRAKPHENIFEDTSKPCSVVRQSLAA